MVQEVDRVTYCRTLLIIHRKYSILRSWDIPQAQAENVVDPRCTAQIHRFRAAADTLVWCDGAMRRQFDLRRGLLELLY